MYSSVAFRIFPEFSQLWNIFITPKGNAISNDSFSPFLSNPSRPWQPLLYFLALWICLGYISFERDHIIKGFFHGAWWFQCLPMSFGFSLPSGMVQNSLLGLSPISRIEEWFIDRQVTDQQPQSTPNQRVSQGFRDASIAVNEGRWLLTLY